MSKNVFVSYAHADIEPVKKIINSLRAVPEVEVWYDSNLRGGGVCRQVQKKTGVRRPGSNDFRTAEEYEAYKYLI